MPSSFAVSHIRFPLHIYLHCITSVEYLAELNASVPGLDLYAERALLLAEQYDLVAVPDEVDPDYLAYLAELGLGPSPANLVVASRFSRSDSRAPLWQRLLDSTESLDMLSCLIRRHGSASLHPFIASQGQFELARALEQKAGVPVVVSGSDARVVAHVDHKHHVRAKAIELGIPVAQGEVVDLAAAGCGRNGEEAALRRAIERQMAITGRVIVRGTLGAAGSATFAVDATEQIPALAQRLAGRRENRIYLVEAMVDMTVSPNVQMHIGREKRAIRCGGMTDQRWKQPLVHGGSMFPSASGRVAEMLGWSRTLAEWLHSVGYAGVAGLDFVEYTDREGAPQAFLAEVNPRTNGATYPLRLRRRLNLAQREAGFPEIKAFVSGTVEPEAGTFAELREIWDDRLFCPARGAGLVPYMPGLLRHGKCGVVALAPTREEANELYREAGAAAQAA